MDGENNFWLAIWRTVAATFGVLVLTIGGCSSYRSRLIAEMTASGVDPLAASCAVHGGDANHSVCVGLIIAKSK